MRGLYYADWHEFYTGNLALAVAKSSHSVSLIVREGAPEFRGRHEDAAQFRRKLREGVDQLYELPGSYWSIRSALKLRKFIRAGERFDYLHIQPPGDPRFLLAVLRIPTVLTLHEPGARTGVTSFRFTARGLVIELVRRIYREAAAVIVVHTLACREKLSPREQRKAVVIPHGVTESGGGAPSLAANAEHRTILFFGRAARYKGIDVLLAAMREVWETHPEARLRILASPGDPECEVHDLDSRIDAGWSGFSEAELTEALAEAHAVCLPYTTVSGTGVGGRAYGAGKPIVASDLEGLRELVSDAELLCEPGSASDLARALKLVLSRNYAPQQVDPERTWPGVAKSYISLYASLPYRPRIGLS